MTIHCDENDQKKVDCVIYAADVADAIMFIMNLPHGGFKLANDWGGATCPKFNIVGQKEYSNLEVATKVAEIMGAQLKTKFVGYDSQRPGHDFRYALSGEYMKTLGWVPRQDFEARLRQVVEWTLKNSRWLSF